MARLRAAATGNQCPVGYVLSVAGLPTSAAIQGAHGRWVFLLSHLTPTTGHAPLRCFSVTQRRKTPKSVCPCAGGIKVMPLCMYREMKIAWVRGRVEGLSP